MLQPGRQYSVATGYRYGFNGKEMDNEVLGQGNQYDYGFRIYNPRLGRFLSVDPISRSYPMLTPYQFASNCPIANVDMDGEEAKYFVIEFFDTYNSKGKLVHSDVRKTDETSQETGWFVHGKIYESHGKHGEGELYRIYGSKTILNDDGSESIESKQIGAIYIPPPPKPSPDRPKSNCFPAVSPCAKICG